MSENPKYVHAPDCTWHPDECSCRADARRRASDATPAGPFVTPEAYEWAKQEAERIDAMGEEWNKDQIARARPLREFIDEHRASSPAPVPGDLVARLRKPVLNEETMKGWDYVRWLIAEGNDASLPRDIFESHVEELDWERAEAADRIEALEKENVQMRFALGYPMPAELEHHIIPTNPFRCGTCDARAARAEALEQALRKIANSPHCIYPDNPDSYQTGVVDGHRCAAKMARAALGENNE